MKIIPLLAFALMGIALVRENSGVLKVEESVPIQEGLLLPDLQVSAPKELYIEVGGDTKNIRFNTTFMNIGKGTFEMRGRTDYEKQTTVATQIIYKKDGSGTVEREVGEFVFHPTHNHWHTDNYVVFELWSLNEENFPQEVAASTGKMSFCIWDENPFDLSIENASPEPQFPGECANETQGLSVGWSDTYKARVDGQELDINNVDDGKFMVRTIINPDKRFLESEYSNNEAVLFIEIRGNELQILNES